MKRAQPGFTLLELMVVLAIAGVLFAVGIPAMGNFVRNSRITAAANDVMAALHFTRSEAIKRRMPLTLCTSASAVTDANPTCANSAFLTGWIAFVDTNQSGDRDAGEVVLLQHEPMNVLHLVRTDGKCLPLATGSFDRIVARESLCYVPDEQFDQLLREVCRVMVSGATFYLLEQVSENPAWQHHPKAPHLKKRPVSEILNAAARAGLVLTQAVVVRQPRFPWINAVWLGIVPARVIRSLAGAEVSWNRIVCPLRTHRWENVLFVFRKP